MHVHEEVLAAANQIARLRDDWTFTPFEVVKALPLLNESSVRTHIVSRCCVNAPKNHLHKWDYFRRVGHGRYAVLPKYRSAQSTSALPAASETISQQAETRHSSLRDIIHAVVHPDEDGYYVECLEVAVITQGDTLDDLLKNLDEALALHLEGEDLAALGLSSHPKLQLIIEKPIAA